MSSSRPIRLTRRGHVVVAAVGVVLVAVQTAAVVGAQASGTGLLGAAPAEPALDLVAAGRVLAVQRADRSGRPVDVGIAGPVGDRLDDESAARPAVAEPVPGAPITAVFGEHGSNWEHRHTGLDFNGFTGDQILAVADATVAQVLEHPAYGLMLVLRRDDGVEFRYAHLSKVLVRRGAVEAGQPVALMGNTGNSTGSHLHLEVRVNGVPTDPAAFFWGPSPGQPAAPPQWACALYPGC